MNSGAPRRRVRVLAAVAAGTALVVGLALGYLDTRYLSPGPQAGVDKLHIALPTLPHSALLHIAAAKGYFAEEGLDVSITPTIYGRPALERVARHQADFAAVADGPFVISVMKGEPLAVAAGVLSVSDENAVVARRDRGIAAPLDLAGKKIGVTFGTGGEYFLWTFLIRHRLTPESVTLVDLPPGQLATALAKGTIDAAATWQPIVLDTQAALGENAMSFTGVDAYTLNFLLIGRSAFLKGHPRATGKLVRSLLKAEQFLQSRPEEALKLVAEWLKIDARTLQPTWKNFNFRVNLLQSHLISLEDQVRWAMTRGYVPSGPVPNLLPNLYLDALLAVRPERVTVVH